MSLVPSMSIVVAMASGLGLLSNLNVIALRFIKRNTATTFQMLLGMLALNDFVLSILFAFLAPIMYRDYVWIYSSFACKLLFPSITTVSAVNVGTILLISYERYRAIKHPFRPKLTFRRMILTVLVVWIVSIFFAIPKIIALELGEDGVCEEHWSNATFPKIYSAVLLVFVYLVPLIGIATFHIIIVHKLKQTDGSRANYCISQNFNANSVIICRRQRNMKIMKLLTVISMVFAVCILPTKIQYVIGDFAPDLFTEGVSNALHVYQGLFYFHVVMNPVFYSLADKHFRKDMLQLLCCKLTEMGNSSFRVTK